jgi:hypothetical protein
MLAGRGSRALVPAGSATPCIPAIRIYPPLNQTIVIGWMEKEVCILGVLKVALSASSAKLTMLAACHCLTEPVIICLIEMLIASDRSDC